MFPIWQIDKGMNYGGNGSQWKNRMSHVVCCSSINDPSTGFISLPINYLSSKDRMTKIRWNPKGITFDKVEGEDDVEGKEYGMEE